MPLPPHDTAAVTGAILAGGNSVRMGQDKAILRVRGMPMIRLIAETLRAVVPEVIIVVSRPDAYVQAGLRVVADLVDNRGPLGGLYTALHASGMGSVFVLACDTPFVTPELIRYVMDFDSDRPASVALCGGQLHPLCALYRRTSLPAVTRHLQEGRLAMVDLLAALEATEVPITPDLPFWHDDLLANINTPADLRRHAGPAR